MNYRLIFSRLLVPVFLIAVAQGEEKAAPAKAPAKVQAKPPLLNLPVSFDRKLSRDGFSFVVAWPAKSRASSVEIIPTGLSQDNSTVTLGVSGAVIGAQVDDLDGDNFPEVYVFTKTPDGKGDVVAITVDRGRSLVGISLQSPEADGVKGHRGGDEFRISEERLMRTFPVYNEKDADGSPTGGQRQITYRLYQQGDRWSLVKVLVVDL